MPPTSDTSEAPANEFLADSPSANTHRNSYNQGSTGLPGPEEAPTSYQEDWLPGRAGLITANFSNRYSNGQRIIWSYPVLGSDNIS